MSRKSREYSLPRESKRRPTHILGKTSEGGKNPEIPSARPPPWESAERTGARGPRGAVRARRAGMRRGRKRARGACPLTPIRPDPYFSGGAQGAGPADAPPHGRREMSAAGGRRRGNARFRRAPRRAVCRGAGCVRLAGGFAGGAISALPRALGMQGAGGLQIECSCFFYGGWLYKYCGCCSGDR